MIEAYNISKSYGPIQAVQDLSFQIKAGEIVGFLGVNGSGKSTTLDMLAGCLGPDSGSIRICSYALAEDPLAAKACLAYLPAEPALTRALTVEEALCFSAAIHGLSAARTQVRIAAVLADFHLDGVRKRRIGGLSKGFVQRVALAQAFLHEPRVLLLDEPTEGLDPIQIRDLREILRRQSPGRAILLSSHILGEIAEICTSVLVIHHGQLVGRLQVTRDLKGRLEELFSHLTSERGEHGL